MVTINTSATVPIEGPKQRATVAEYPIFTVVVAEPPLSLSHSLDHEEYHQHVP